MTGGAQCSTRILLGAFVHRRILQESRITRAGSLTENRLTFILRNGGYH